MKLWNKGYNINNLVEKYTVGKDRDLDLYLAKYDVLVNIAHIKMLNKINIISNEDTTNLINELNNINKDIETGNFKIEKEFEDVHSKIEYILTKKYGEAGKKIHTARSRNDQVLTDIHLYIKNEVIEIKKLIKGLFEILLILSEKHKDKIIPGYTHLQVAMPSSFGLWFSAYAETLIDDIILFNAVYEISNQNPLGSAAGYGSSFPIDRKITTEELDFKFIKVSSAVSQITRGKIEKTTAFALSSISGSISKLCSDICLFLCQNFNFISFPKELTTGSSIMPHKKNPDVFEIMRAKCNKIQNLPNEIIIITNNLTSGYHRDFQLLKENLIFGIEDTKNNLFVLKFMLEHISVKKDIEKNDKYKYMFSVEELNKMVTNGMGFRDAYKKLGKQIEKKLFVTNKKIDHSHIGSIGNLSLNLIREKFNYYF